MLVLLLVAGLLVVNMAASLYVWAKADAPASQRRLQLLVIWLLPVVGAVLCVMFVGMARSSEGQGQDARWHGDGGGTHTADPGGWRLHAESCDADIGDGAGADGGSGD
jgi:hypothetical protein